MSFSKAKIIRFNDIVKSTPSSANYNLSKDKGSEKTKKAASTTGNQSPATSDNGSVKSVPGNFKTDWEELIRIGELEGIDADDSDAILPLDARAELVKKMKGVSE